MASAAQEEVSEEADERPAVSVMVDSSPQANVQALRALFTQRDESITLTQKPKGTITKSGDRVLDDGISTSTDYSRASNSDGRSRPLPSDSSDSQSPKLASPSRDTHSSRTSSPNEKLGPKPLPGPKPVINKGASSHTLPNSMSASRRLSIDAEKGSAALSNGTSNTRTRLSLSMQELDSQLHSTDGQQPDQIKKPFLPTEPTVSFKIKPQVEKLSKVLCTVPNGLAPGLLHTGRIPRPTPPPELVTVNNYICNNKLPSKPKYRRKELPREDKLGPAPLKPLKSPQIQLTSSVAGKLRALAPALSAEKESTPVLPPRPVARVQPPLPLPPPPRDLKLPPVPPGLPSATKSHSLPGLSAGELHDEEEELYEDTLPLDDENNLSLTIPEYTEEEELGKRISGSFSSHPGSDTCSVPPRRPRYPPPPPPSSSSAFSSDASDQQQEDKKDIVPEDEIYDDADSVIQKDEDSTTEIKKRDDKLRKEEKKMKKEQKERERQEREVEKLKKKFGLVGEETPLDSGVVKIDSRGGRYDLPVKRGESVLIIRMENNPSGKWLARNETGRIGYVEVTNIEVDADSIKSVMRERSLSIQGGSGDGRCHMIDEAVDETQAIYEETY